MYVHIAVMFRFLLLWFLCNCNKNAAVFTVTSEKRSKYNITFWYRFAAAGFSEEYINAVLNICNVYVMCATLHVSE